MDIKDIKDLILTIDKTSIQRVDIEKGDVKIGISKSVNNDENKSEIKDNPVKIEKSNEEEKNIDNNVKDTSDDVYVVKSPIVGVFYRASSPDAKAFVNIGDKVDKGATLCIIEAMKIMNEIESEISGEIVEILVDNEEVVEYGQPLMKIRR